MRTSGFRCWLLLACVVCCSRGMVAQDLRVLVLDALDGKPQGDVKVEYFCTGTPDNSAPKTTLTNDEGIAKVPILCSNAQEIDILIFPPNKKEQCGVGPATLKEMLSVGVVGKPDADGGIWCPTKVSRTVKPVPGQVILFVKKPTWYQSHFAG
jgi:hypothetical protein